MASDSDAADGRAKSEFAILAGGFAVLVALALFEAVKLPEYARYPLAAVALACATVAYLRGSRKHHKTVSLVLATASLFALAALGFTDAAPVVVTVVLGAFGLSVGLWAIASARK